jgi:hypothetical protein
LSNYRDEIGDELDEDDDLDGRAGANQLRVPWHVRVNENLTRWPWFGSLLSLSRRRYLSELPWRGSRLNSGLVAQTEGPTWKEGRLENEVLKPLSILGNGELNTRDAARKREP